MNAVTSLASWTQELCDVDERLLVEDNQWYVRTREIPQLGPFASRDEAVTGLHKHIELWNRPELPSTVPVMPASTVHRLEDCDKPNCGLCAELTLLRECAMPRACTR